MLVSLTLRDYAIVDALTVDLGSGLTALTGETGAGKSILIDAVGALLGDRVDPDDVRAGATRAYLEAVFDVRASDDTPAALLETLEELGVEPEDGTLIVSREIAGASGGRSIARVNGRAVPSSALGRLGQHLVDIHGQSQHLSLLRPRDQLEQLDRYAGLQDERHRMAALSRELRDIRSNIRNRVAEQEALLREADLLRFQTQEIATAAPEPNEDERLQERRARLRNVERLRTLVHVAFATTAGSDDAPAALDLVGQAQRAIEDAARLDPSLGGSSEVLLAAHTHLEDVEHSLRRYLDDLDADPAELETIEERVLLLADLKRKYGPSLADVIAFLERTEARLQGLERGDEDVESLRVHEAAQADKAAALAAHMSARRRESASQLERAVEQELRDLGMPGARLRVLLAQAAADDGLNVESAGGETRLLRFDSTGVDRVELLFSASPGSEPRPLAHVASGGELARIGLAIKTVVSEDGETPTLIFDEVDVGVGGRTAGVVGRKLWNLGRSHQVLCVTHLPQVAAFADQHLFVARQVAGMAARSTVSSLGKEARVAELAAMLAGPQPTLTAQLNAQELIERADEHKRIEAKPVARSRR